jgi:addiction module HigA family antidote
MILGFRDKRTEVFANGEHVRAFQGFERQAWKRLEILSAASSLTDLAGLPSNRLEALKGDRSGQYSIRINQQWRICFEWPNGLKPRDRRLYETHPWHVPQYTPAKSDELDELGITPTELSRQISVPPNRISQIIQGKRAITGDTALRLGHWFQTSPQFWLNLQAAYDLRVASENAGREIAALPTKQALRVGGR